MLFENQCEEHGKYKWGCTVNCCPRCFKKALVAISPFNKDFDLHLHIANISKALQTVTDENIRDEAVKSMNLLFNLTEKCSKKS